MIIRILLLIAALLAPVAPAIAERAASIEYEFVARPVAVPAEQAGENLRFLEIRAIDGARVKAALWQPGGARQEIASSLSRPAGG